MSAYPSTEAVRLRSAVDIEAEGNSDHRYLALSHCWGTDKFLTLNKLNIESFQQGLEAGGLTKTFQEAIWPTSSLGVRFIWIDSVCIIQDSAEDSATKAASTADVYRFCMCTIAAVNAWSGAEGFLRS